MSTELQQFANEIRSGNRRALSRAITLIESTRADHRNQADELLKQLAANAKGSIRLGVSGVPGVGKSTFIESLGMHIIEQGLSLAVLAVDPSSAISGGSIMGDKTRMEKLARSKNAFIRPSPSGGTLGGVARKSRETLLLCEAAGFDVILVETVGVGQSETTVADMTDMFLLLLLPGSGDELQGIKRGIMELADLVLINKADGDTQAKANHSAADFIRALTLLHPRTKNWRVPVKTCSSLTGAGIAESWQLIKQYHQLLIDSGELSQRRARQSKAWLWTEISNNLLTALQQNDQVKQQLKTIEADVVSGILPASQAAKQLISLFKNSNDAKHH